MAVVKEDRFVFKVEWYDDQAAIIREYLFTFYPKDSTAEMYDCKMKRIFMKRSGVLGVTARELFIGSVITVHTR